jgi:hypothetical protein
MGGDKPGMRRTPLHRACSCRRIDNCEGVRRSQLRLARAMQRVSDTTKAADKSPLGAISRPGDGSERPRGTVSQLACTVRRVSRVCARRNRAFRGRKTRFGTTQNEQNAERPFEDCKEEIKGSESGGACSDHLIVVGDSRCRHAGRAGVRRVPLLSGSCAWVMYIQ